MSHTEPHWGQIRKSDPRGRELADRHYSRRTVGATLYCPPGNSLVLLAPGALWITIRQKPKYVRHKWKYALVNSIFRNESDVLSSDLIREAVEESFKRFYVHPQGLITMIDRARVAPKRNPGYCFLMAGFEVAGETAGGLLVLQVRP